MGNKSVKGFSGWAQLGILFGLTGMGLILAGIAQFVIAYMAAPNTPLMQMDKVLMDPANATYMQAAQIAGTFFMLFLPSALFILVCYGKSARWAGFNKHININQIIIGSLIMFCANILAQPFEEFSKQVIAHFPSLNSLAIKMEKMYADQVEAMVQLKTIPQLIGGIVLMAFLPGLFEELFFRGALQNLLTRWWAKPVLAIIVSSIIFSVIHFSIYLFLSRAILGFVLGWMFFRSKNIWINIFAHFTNNAFVVVQLFFASKAGKANLAEVSNEKMPIWLVLGALIVICVLLILFEKVSSKNRAIIEAEEDDLTNKSLAAQNPFYNMQNDLN